MSDGKPKPRPRPKARFGKAATLSTEPSTSAKIRATPAQATANNASTTDETNDYFRKTKSWGAIDAHTRNTPASRGVLDISSDDDDYSGSPAKKKKGNRAGSKSHVMPEWTRHTHPGNVFRDTTTPVESEEERGRRTASSESTGGTKSKGKRPRPVSRSLTPPPQMSAQMRLQARNLARQHFRETDSDPTSYSRSLADDDDDDFTNLSTPSIKLAPALQEIAQNHRTTASGKVVTGSTNLKRGLENINVRVRLIPHPEDEAAQEMPEESWEFMIKRDDTFKEVFNETAAAAHLMVRDLILCHDDRRIFPASSPKTLDVWANVELAAYDTNTYKYIRAQQQVVVEPTPAPSHHRGGSESTTHDGDETPDDQDPDASSPPPSSPPPFEPEPDAEEADQQRIRLSFRSNAYPKAYMFNLRRTMTCATIVKRYLEKVGAKGAGDPKVEGKCRLVVEGESLDPASMIGDADLEEEEMVEVHGL